MRLKNRQIAETALRQGKIADTHKLSAELSTGFVEGFALAPDA
jgi:hypothetical protein